MASQAPYYAAAAGAPPMQQQQQQQASAAAAPSPSPSPPPNPSMGNGLVITPMAPPPPPQNVRMEGGRVMERIDKPFVYGSAAFWQGKGIPDTQHSHKWTVYLRGLENEDLSYFIHSVTFALHPSFAEPNRELFQAPYEVTETGWGEFVIGITIKFRAVSGLEPIVLQHTLKLFPLPHVQPSTKKPVMSEVYDEFVFVNPSKEWFDMLHSGPTKKVDNHPLMHHFTTPEFAKEEDQSIAKLQATNNVVQAAIDQQRVRLFAVDQDITNLTQRL